MRIFEQNIFYKGHPTLGITVDKVSVMVPDASADDINCFLDLIYNGEMETDETRKATIESLMILFSVTKVSELGLHEVDDISSETIHCRISGNLDMPGAMTVKLKTKTTMMIPIFLC